MVKSLTLGPCHVSSWLKPGYLILLPCHKVTVSFSGCVSGGPLLVRPELGFRGLCPGSPCCPVQSACDRCPFAVLCAVSLPSPLASGAVSVWCPHLCEEKVSCQGPPRRHHVDTHFIPSAVLCLGAQPAQLWSLSCPSGRCLGPFSTTRPVWKISDFLTLHTIPGSSYIFLPWLWSQPFP